MSEAIVPPSNLLALITKHECLPGKPPPSSPYRDSRGFLTVGVGHNLDANPLPGEAYPMSPDRIQEVLADDLQNTIAPLEDALPWIVDLDEVRQAVLIDMAFNMGVRDLLTFKHTLAAVQQANWQLAHDDMLASEPWCSEVGPRAIEDATMMLTGEWPF